MSIRRAAWAIVLSLLPLALSAKTIPVAREMTLEVPDAWSAMQDTKTTWLLEHRTPAGVDATMSIAVETRRSHDEAVARLAQIEVEHRFDVVWKLIAGWPALERKVAAPFKTRDKEEDPPNWIPEDPKLRANPMSLRVTTAIAVDRFVVVIRTLLLPESDPKVADEALEIGRRFRAPEAKEGERVQLEKLRSGSLRPQTPKPHGNAPKSVIRKKADGKRPGEFGGASIQVNGGGEIEATVSMNGEDFVTDAACSIMFSTDGGGSFTASAVSWAGVPPNMDGDCTLTWGQSGNFYIGRLGTQWLGFGTSTDNGANFNFTALAVDRRNITNVDQPHIAADRWNASSSNQDRVYIVWQETGNFVSRVACSTDSGATWTAPVSAASGNFAYPRVSVGQDGMVYVASRSGGSITVDKFSDCDAGLAEQMGFPVSFAISDVPCPGGVPGLDRCNNGNTLSSPTIAVDDTDANHVYIAWAQTNGAATGQDITIADSNNGGQNWNAGVIVNGAPVGVRFMPWLGTWGGVAYTGWYDRRNATAASNDLTSYYRGSASVVNGVLTAGTEVNLTGVDDPQCASGWACGVRSPLNSDNCSTQPQNAGYCGAAPAGARCDFTTGCPAMQACVTWSGCPKYGDYNGLAVSGGRLLNIWASGTAPSDLPAAPSNFVRAYVSVADLPSNFFVRDWTDNATTHDTGVEPSIRENFWTKSDVWNQLTDAPGVPADDWIAGSDAQRGAGAAGDNFAFTRVSRRAAAADTVADAPVTAHFVSADFGIGAPYGPAGVAADAIVTMTASDLTKTMTAGYPWHVDASASTHVCLAVEISATGDAGQPTLEGRSSWSNEIGPLLLGDNNKAQRNLWTVAGAMGGGGGWSAALRVFPEGLRGAPKQRIRIRVPHDFERLLTGATIGVAGGPMQKLTGDGELRLGELKPGENQWIVVNFGRITAPEGTRIPIDVVETRGEMVTNGVTVMAVVVPLDRAMEAVRREQASVLGRIGEKTIERAIARVVKQGGDPFDLKAALKTLQTVKDDVSKTAAQQALLARLDVAITRNQLANGDPNAVLHNVLWQRELFANAKGDAAARLVKMSEEFIARWDHRRAHRDDFTKFVAESFDTLAAAVKENGGGAASLDRLHAAMNGGNLAALQKAHRGVLLAMP